MGNDLCRALLLFDEKKPLGERGLTWLKIHCANLFGYDKYELSMINNVRLPFEKRIQFVEDNLARIFACADNPLDGDKWWLEAEYPWQFLSSSMELRDALNSPNPLEFLSDMPVHQDGTCNGLQHYAALGRDVGGARQVNLVPNDKPSDVYTGIADSVEVIVNRDAEEGDATALLLKGHINRKLVKQTVMTNTYGVTMMGARDQVKARLKENKDLVLNDSELQKATNYITEKIFESYGGLFTAAQAIQNWVRVDILTFKLYNSARMISKSVHYAKIPEATLNESNMLMELGGKSISDKLSIAIAKSLKDAKPEPMPPIQDDPVSELLKLSTNEEMMLRNPDMRRMERFASEEAELSLKNPMRKASVAWTTPVGLPVCQPYRNYKTKTVS